ncbi:hypothetical protein NFC73_08380 [Pseudarthrobacter sp. RMG13]|uniref:Alpha/beta hydrolase n=1 Tax=Pseudarthrobacter humi TaxID=2952523 RepID=A0ABT1LMS1_9MICC|nr:hypothetical protein [Pseudarthrobacter humi]MCP8999748.1 hypothetical protein [Pseudarthrobacter humi]
MAVKSQSEWRLAVPLKEHLGRGEDAGHALMHERPELLAALFGDWLDRAQPEDE